MQTPHNAVTTAHGLIQTARGLCTDEASHVEIDALLAQAVDAVKDLEAERDRAMREADAMTRTCSRCGHPVDDLERTHARRALPKEALTGPVLFLYRQDMGRDIPGIKVAMIFATIIAVFVIGALTSPIAACAVLLAGLVATALVTA